MIKNRLAVYHEKTKPVIGYYDEKGLLRRIDGTRDPGDVHDHIRAVIATLLRLEKTQYSPGHVRRSASVT